jgi:hypothetical protein
MKVRALLTAVVMTLGMGVVAAPSVSALDPTDCVIGQLIIPSTSVTAKSQWSTVQVDVIVKNYELVTPPCKV